MLHAVGQIADDHMELFLAENFTGAGSVGTGRTEAADLPCLEMLGGIGKAECSHGHALGALHGAGFLLHGMLHAVIS